MSDLRFSVYGVGLFGPGVTFDELVGLAREDALVARAESSASEGCCVEVARYSARKRAWCRYAFKKFFGGEDLPREEQDALPSGDPRLSSVMTAKRVAARINQASPDLWGMIHKLPDYPA